MGKLKKSIAVLPAPICKIYEQQNQLGALKEEDVINIEVIELSEAEASLEIQMCEQHLKINDIVLKNQLIRSISIRAFDKLFHLANSLKTNDVDTYPIHFFTGVRIYFGVKDGDIFTLFRPVYIKRPATIPGQALAIYEGGIYTYVDFATKEFQPASSKHLARIKAYEDQIKIKQNSPTASYEKFDKLLDVNSVIFPFQTIYSLENCNSTNNKRLDDIFLFSSIREEEGRIKHCILLSPGKIPIDPEEDPAMFANLTGKYANRSHLCPPNQIDFDIAQLGPTVCP